MNLRKRLERLELLVKPVAGRVCNRDMKCIPWEELLKTVEDAVASADDDLLTEILGLVEAHGKESGQNQTSKETHLDPQDREITPPHFFVIWLWGLEEGSWRLPARLPRELLEGFCRPYGCVLFRCEDCLTGLGNARLYAECPVCHSVRISCKKLSGPPWDPLWVYTPLPKVCHAKKKERQGS
jgi:hypothetical protein